MKVGSHSEKRRECELSAYVLLVSCSMKPTTILLVGVLLWGVLGCQKRDHIGAFQTQSAKASVHDDAPISLAGELPLYHDSLIYKPSTVRKLQKVVDSLNLKYKACSLTQPYRSWQQSEGDVFRLETKNKKLYEGCIKFLSSKSDLEVLRSLLKISGNSDSYLLKENFALRPYAERDGKVEVVLLPTSSSKHLFSKPIVQHNYAGSCEWIYEAKVYDYSNAGPIYLIVAVRPYKKFETQDLPSKYGSMVLYSDCIIDSSKSIQTKFIKNESYFLDMGRDTTIEARNAIINKIDNLFTDRDKYPDYPRGNFSLNGELDSSARKKYEERVAVYERSVKEWKYRRELMASKLAMESDSFCYLIKTLARIYPPAVLANPDLSKWFFAYCPDVTIIDSARNQVVWGSCSQDDSPRIFAQSLAVLGADAGNFEVFLRSHLNILNDNFNRLSDGSYAWDRRGTYIRELEALGIDVPKLLIGSVLRVSNGSPKRYVSSVSRLGRAIVESKERERFLQLIREGISAEDLDPFNRVILQNLMLTYIYHLPTKLEHQQALTQYKAFAQPLPDYLKLDALAAKPRREE